MKREKNINEELTQTVRVRDKHEITIPKNIRNHLQLKTGDLIELEAKPDGQICIHKIKTIRVKPNNGGNGGEFSTTKDDPISPQEKNGEKDQT